jgi:glycerol kinase
MACVLALDQGTTSSRALLVDGEGRLAGMAQRPFTQLYPRPGWVEHDPEEIRASQLGVVAEVMARAGIRSADLAAIGITNQRETTVVWERATGRPIANAIVWQDRRTADVCDRLRAQGAEALVAARTGLVLDAYFSATKVAWLLDAIPGARREAEAGRLCFGTIDSWLVWTLTGGRVHVTDATNAARTLLFDIHRLAWDDELLALFRVPRPMLPEVVASSGLVAETAIDPLATPVPIAGIAGDQQAALFGQMCHEAGQVKTTYGTGCFMLLNTGRAPIPSRNRLVATLAWERPGDRRYALEGSVFVAGAIVQWLRDGLGLIREAADIGPLAARVADADGVMLVPALTGLGAPYWDPHARGTIIGLSRGTTAAHIARAALDGIAHQVADVLDAMRGDAGLALTEMRVDGGAAASDLLMQIQADLAQVPIVRPRNQESTAMGAAYLAGLATGVWPDAATVAGLWQADRRFEPRLTPAGAAHQRDRWRAAVTRARAWAED